MAKRLTTNETITLVLSALALLASLASLYFQFFHISESVTAAKVGFNAELGGQRGKFSLDIALINNGNRDALILRCEPEIAGLTFAFQVPLTSSPILKPQEIKPISFRGAFEISSGAKDGETPVDLGYRIVGARGFDIERRKRIGSVEVVAGKLVGIEILKWPIVLD